MSTKNHGGPPSCPPSSRLREFYARTSVATTGFRCSNPCGRARVSLSLPRTILFRKAGTHAIFEVGSCKHLRAFHRQLRPLTAQQKTSKKPVATAPATPVDEVVNTLFATRRFEQTAISPDGKKIAWVETFVGKDGAPDGNTAIYITDRDTSAARNASPPPPSISLARRKSRLVTGQQAACFSLRRRQTGQLQLYVVSPSGGAARKFTSVKGLLATPRWSPTVRPSPFSSLRTPPAPRARSLPERPRLAKSKTPFSNNASRSSTSPQANSVKALQRICTSTNTTGRRTARASPSSPRTAMATTTGTSPSSTRSTPVFSAS